MSGTRRQFLQFVYNNLLTLVPISVESERAFSAAGYIATEMRCRLSDSTISRHSLFFKELFPKSPLGLHFEWVILIISSLKRYYFIFVNFQKKKK